jgi:hypothetical protein
MAEPAQNSCDGARRVDGARDATLARGRPHALLRLLCSRYARTLSYRFALLRSRHARAMSPAVALSRNRKQAARRRELRNRHLRQIELTEI